MRAPPLDIKGEGYVTIPLGHPRGDSLLRSECQAVHKAHLRQQAFLGHCPWGAG